MRENLSSLLHSNKTELEEYIRKYEYLNKIQKELTSSIKQNIDATNNFFNKSGGIIENVGIMTTSAREDMLALNKAMEEQIATVKKVNNAIEEMSTHYNMTKEKVAETLPLLGERAKLQQKLNEMGNPSLLTGDDIETWNQFSNEIERIEKKIGKLGIASKRMMHDFDTGNDNIKNAIKLEDELAQATENVNKAQLEYNKSMDEAIERADKFKKSGWFDILSTGWDMLKKSVSLGANKFLEIDQMAHDFGRNMGMSAQEISVHSKGITENYGDMAARLGMEVKDIYKFQTNYAEATEKAVILTHEQVESMGYLSRNAGEQAINVASKNLDIFATSADATIEYLAKGTARASMEGLNVKKYSEAFANNIKMASKYTFKEGINGIQKMTLMSQRLKFNMESIGSAMDKFSTLQGAIEASAKIQVLGGAFAQNFGNPLEAMSEALLDAEGFTKRIINTVSSQAKFNSKTGEIDLANIDKQRLKTMSEALGISYDELHNMATQSRKEQIIKSQVAGNNLDEDTESYLINKAQYNKATGKWHLTKANGEKYEKDISQMTKEEIKDISSRDTYEKMLQSDVAGIHKILQGKGESELSHLEKIKGFDEKIATGIADMFNSLGGWVGTIVAAITTSKILGGLGNLGGNLVGRVGRGGFNFLAKGQGIGGAIGKTTLGRQFRKMNIAKTKFMRKIGLGRNTSGLQAASTGRAAQTIGKGLKFAKAGGALTVAFGAIEGYSAYKGYQNAKEDILKEKNMSQKEKAKALNDAKKERNKGYGSAVGGVAGGFAGMAAGAAIGAKIGTIAGTVVPGLGNVIGAIGGTIVGGLVGLGSALIGSKIGEAMTEDVEETMKEVREGSDNLDDPHRSSSETIEESNDINVIVSKIEQSVLGIGENISIMKSHVIRMSDLYNESFNNHHSTIKNKNTHSTINVSDMKLNVEGQIKLVSDTTLNAIDISEIMSQKKFKDEIVRIVQNAMREEPSGRLQPI